MKDETITARYFNANGFACGIVAVITRDDDGHVITWAAYMGGTDLVQREKDAIDWIAENGCKISLEDAAHYYSWLPANKYRD